MFRSSLYFVVFLLLFFPMSYEWAAVTLVSDGWLTSQLQQKQPIIPLQPGSIGIHTERH